MKNWDNTMYGMKAYVISRRGKEEEEKSLYASQFTHTKKSTNSNIANIQHKVARRKKNRETKRQN